MDLPVYTADSTLPTVAKVGFGKISLQQIQRGSNVQGQNKPTIAAEVTKKVGLELVPVQHVYKVIGGVL